MQITVGIITISDRAAAGEYEDLGGPALKGAAEMRTHSDHRRDRDRAARRHARSASRHHARGAAGLWRGDAERIDENYAERDSIAQSRCSH